MREKSKIHYDLINTANWKDEDRSRKAHQTDLLIEVLTDIRDLFEGVLGFLATYYEDGITPK